MAEEKPRLLWVKSADPDLCGCWDRDSDQVNDGEVFISGTEPFQCRATPGINQAIADRRLIEVSSPSSVPKSPPK